MQETRRREFLKTATLAATAGLVARCAGQDRSARSNASPSVMGLTVNPLERVRFGLIGVGERGSVHTDLLCRIEGAQIMAISDPHEEVLDRAMGIVEQHGRPAPQRIAGGEYGYRQMLDRDDIDAVLISTPWRWHAPMAIEAMESGKHAFVEVPMASTVEECWQLVDTAERTQKNCMMM